MDNLQRKVQEVTRTYDPTLRCAMPVSEALNARFPLPALPDAITLIAADGSQIFADRHEELDTVWLTPGQSGCGTAQRMHR